MEDVVVPGGRIVDVTGMSLDQDPAAVYKVTALHDIARQTGKSWLDDVFLPPVKVMVNGACYECFVELLTAPYRMIILECIEADTRVYWLLREHIDDAWYACTRMLVMSCTEQDVPAECDESTWAFERVYRFVAAAVAGDWFERKPVCYITPD